MNTTLSLANTQRQRLSAQRQSINSTTLFNALTSDALFDELERLSPDHRERLFTPTETLSMFLTQSLSADRSCQNIVNQAAIDRLTSGLPLCSSHTGAYCRARQRLPVDLISGLTRYLGTHIDQGAPSNWNWKGKQVYIADGTTMTMPDTETNQSSFPQQGAQKPGLGFPTCRFVGVLSLSSGMLLDGAIGPFKGKGSTEQALLRKMSPLFQSGSLLLGDAFYPTWFFLAKMQQQGADILMEQHGSRQLTTNFTLGKPLGERDHLIQLDKPKRKPDWLTQEEYDAAPHSIQVREFKAGGKIMVTTLMNAKKYPKSELKQLYKSRWNIEVSLRDLKDTMGMNILSCKTPEMVMKEIWVYLLAYNIIRWLMCEAAKGADITPQQISFKHCLQLWLHWGVKGSLMDDSMYHSLLGLMSQQRVGNRPGRVEPRAVKRRPKAYPLLMKKRDLAREDVRENGHPKKLK